MPRARMWRFVDISPSMWWPLIMSVSDMPTTKSSTAPTENNTVTNQVAITSKNFIENFHTAKIRHKMQFRTTPRNLAMRHVVSPAAASISAFAVVSSLGFVNSSDRPGSVISP
jgi:hypothetical protein